MLLQTNNRRDGTVVVVVAVALIAILGVVALSLDGGMLMDKRRQVQCTADAAALAAADDIYLNWWQYKGTSDPTGSGQDAARAVAAANGYVHGQNGCTVTVNIPPLTGPFAGRAGHAEVIINTKQPRYFSRLFGTDDVPYGARAVARSLRGEIKAGIIILDPVGAPSLSAGGNGTVSVTGAPVIVNSGAVGAISPNGGGSLSAPEWDTKGTVIASGGAVINGPFVPTDPVPDPLANLPPPDPSTMTIQSKNKTSLSGNGTKTVTLQPGVYVGGISITGQVNVILAPGIYYMQGGGFSWGGSGNLTGTGVMIYNAPQSTSDVINLTGNGNCVMSPPLTGPYQGMTLFQDRTSTTPMNVAGSGSGTMTMSGTFYCAGANLKVTGNGTTDVIGSQYISYDLTVGGNGTFRVDWTPDLTPGTRDILLVE
ncbi:MAG TPA: pilus assembly protein TadG-related protein [Gemmataceae bacterium]|nr:pilus assembly protein TadG-related protein [Gemmataceae bacterium]